MPLKAQAASRKDAPTKCEMQHRHMAFIAQTIAAMPDHAATLRAAKRSTANQFADALAGSNSRFDRERFLTACQVINICFEES